MPRLPVVERPLRIDRARQDLEVVHPPARLWIEARPLGVVYYNFGDGGSSFRWGCGCGW
jgi:hypothetical protein